MVHNITDTELDQLRQMSQDALELSYSPYSEFRVGSAILTTDGQYIVGANIENASYGATICAERAALVKLATLSSGPVPEIKAIAVSSDLDEPCSPCGICRQFIREFAAKSTPIIMFTKNGLKDITMTLEELLPLSFGPGHLNRTGDD